MEENKNQQKIIIEKKNRPLKATTFNWESSLVEKASHTELMCSICFERSVTLRDHITADLFERPATVIKFILLIFVRQHAKQ